MAAAQGVALGIWNPMTKNIPDKLPERYPKEVKEGSPMDYSGVAYPKPVKKKPKKKGWGRK